jgi:hypothetical protein
MEPAVFDVRTKLPTAESIVTVMPPTEFVIALVNTEPAVTAPLILAVEFV